MNKHTDRQIENNKCAHDLNDRKNEIFTYIRTQQLTSVLINELKRPPLFALGEIVATPAATDLLHSTGVNASSLLERHMHGDFGCVSMVDAIMNLRTIREHELNRVLSAYEIGDKQKCIWIITHRARTLDFNMVSVTTILLPEEY